MTIIIAAVCLWVLASSFAFGMSMDDHEALWFKIVMALLMPAFVIVFILTVPIWGMALLGERWQNSRTE